MSRLAVLSVVAGWHSNASGFGEGGREEEREREAWGCWEGGGMKWLKRENHDRDGTKIKRPERERCSGRSAGRQKEEDEEFWIVLPVIWMNNGEEVIWMGERRKRERERDRQRMESGRIWRMEVKIHCKVPLGPATAAATETTSTALYIATAITLTDLLSVYYLLSSSLISRLTATASFPVQLGIFRRTWSVMLSHDFIPSITLYGHLPLPLLLSDSPTTDSKKTTRKQNFWLASLITTVPWCPLRIDLLYSELSMASDSRTLLNTVHERFGGIRPYHPAI